MKCGGMSPARWAPMPAVHALSSCVVSCGVQLLLPYTLVASMLLVRKMHTVMDIVMVKTPKAVIIKQFFGRTQTCVY